MKRHMHREFAVAEFLPRSMILTFDHEKCKVDGAAHTTQHTQHTQDTQLKSAAWRGKKIICGGVGTRTRTICDSRWQARVLLRQVRVSSARKRASQRAVSSASPDRARRPDHFLNACGKMSGARSVLILSKRKMAQNWRKTRHGMPAQSEVIPRSATSVR